MYFGGMEMTYPEVYSKLNFETAIIIFLKKNGEVRVMFGTRNLNTVSLVYGFQGQKLGGHDTRCNINNGNVAVFDMVAGDARAFNIERLIDIQFVGVISTKEEYDEQFAKFVQFRQEYMATHSSMIDMDTFGGAQ